MSGAALSNKMKVVAIFLLVSLLGALSIFIWFQVTTNQPGQPLKHIFSLDNENIDVEFLGDLTTVEQVLDTENASNENDFMIEGTPTAIDEELFETETKDENMPKINPMMSPYPRKLVHEHSVKANESLSSIAVSEWNDVRLWPDLFYINEEILNGQAPDLIYVGQRLQILEKLSKERSEQGLDFSQEELDYLSTVYYHVYQAYRNEKSPNLKSIDYLLNIALSLVPNFFEQHPNINEIDKNRVLRLLNQKKLIE